MECPICGSVCDPGLYQVKISDMHAKFYDRGVKLTNSEARVLSVIYRRNRPVPRSLLMDALYGNDLDGGPDSGEKILEQFILRIRRKIKKAGLPWEVIPVRGFGYELRESQTTATMRRLAGALAIALLLAHPVIGRLF